MFKRIKETLPDNRKSAMLAIGLALLLTGQVLAKSANIYLLILRYVLFAVSIVIYFYVAFTHHLERVAAKKAKEAQQQ